MIASIEASLYVQTAFNTGLVRASEWNQGRILFFENPANGSSVKLILESHRKIKVESVGIHFAQFRNEMDSSYRAHNWSFSDAGGQANHAVDISWDDVIMLALPSSPFPDSQQVITDLFFANKLETWLALYQSQHATILCVKFLWEQGDHQKQSTPAETPNLAFTSIFEKSAPNLFAKNLPHKMAFFHDIGRTEQFASVESPQAHLANSHAPFNTSIVVLRNNVILHTPFPPAMHFSSKNLHLTLKVDDIIIVLCSKKDYITKERIESIVDLFAKYGRALNQEAPQRALENLYNSDQSYYGNLGIIVSIVQEAPEMQHTQETTKALKAGKNKRIKVVGAG